MRARDSGVRGGPIVNAKLLSTAKDDTGTAVQGHLSQEDGFIASLPTTSAIATYSTNPSWLRPRIGDGWQSNL